MRKWQLHPRCAMAPVAKLSSALGISKLVATLLVQRGYQDPEAAQRFLRPELAHLHSPFAFRSMAKAVTRLKLARERGETIGVFGDYDVDGITSTALLVLALRDHGWDVIYRLPDRLSEGYGLSQAGISDLVERGAGVIVTVDCGIAGYVEIAWAKTRGVDTIVCDHHLPPDLLPPALALLDPKVIAEGYPFAELAGVGVALKLAQALTGELDPRWLELAALGTVADVAPLVGENRVLVAHGLAAMRRTGFPGLKALLSLAGVEPDRLGVGQISFRVAPRLNAIGRLGSASPGVELFLTESEAEAWELAQVLEDENRERQAIEAAVLAEAVAQVEAEADLERDRALVVAGEGWHPGVIGIVAARLVERWQRPALVVSLEGEKGKGSGRSIPAFSLYEGLKKAGDFLTEFGGHHLAAGFSLSRDKLPLFREAFLAVARSELSPEDLALCQRIDAEVNLADLDLETVMELGLLGPFGRGNPEPVLLVRGLHVASARAVGQARDHLRLDLTQAGRSVSGIGFGLGELASELSGCEVDVAFHPEVEEWQGMRNVGLKVRDLRSSGRVVELCCFASEEGPPAVVDLRNMDISDLPGVRPGPRHLVLKAPPAGLEELEQLLAALSPYGFIYLLFGRRELEAQRQAVRRHFPDRDFLARLYLCLKAAGPAGVTGNTLVNELAAATTDKVLKGLAVLEELALVRREQAFSGKSSFRLRKLAYEQKVDLRSSHLFRELEKERRRRLAFLDFLERSPGPVLAAFFDRLWLKSHEMTKNRLIC